MKQQIPVWVALAFLMIFLVVFAGFVFTLQTRGQLVEQVATLEEDVLQSQTEAEAMAADVTAAAVALADAQATGDALSAEISQSQAQVQLPSPTDTPMPEPTATPAPEPATVVPPDISLITPIEGSSILPDEEIEILISVTDNAGVDSVTLTVNNDVVGVYSADEQVLFTIKENWSSAETGDFVIGVSATNAAGIASETLEATVQVGDREAELRSTVAKIQAEVEELRGITANEPIVLTLYTKEELRANFEEIFLEDLDEEDSRRDVIELYAFDFIELDYPLYDVLLDLYSSSVLGFYDPDDKELVVVSDDGVLTPAEQLTLAHEINHALQDQEFGLNFEGQDSEASFARRSLAEGDAVLLQRLYFQAGYFTEAEIGELIEELNADDGPDLTDLPDIILRQQTFPYEEGAAFAQSLYEVGGFANLNLAWENSPVSTEQIMHPDLYLADDLPQIVSLPAYTDTLGAGWELISEDTLGEFSTLLYLEQQVDKGQSELAAGGWGGDRYAVYWNEQLEEVVLVMLGVWDTDSDDLEFARAMTDYAGQKYGVTSEAQPDGSRCWVGADDVICLYQVNETTLVIRAPDTETVGRLRFATRIP